MALIRLMCRYAVRGLYILSGSFSCCEFSSPRMEASCLCVESENDCTVEALLSARAKEWAIMLEDELQARSTHFGSVAKLIVTTCYPQLVVFLSLKLFNIWYSS